MHTKSAEFSLISKLLACRSHSSSDQTVVSAGDDASVFSIGNEIIAISVDACIEERHFSFDYFSPEEVGFKAIQTAASDIVAMGGRPFAAFVALTLANNSEQYLEDLYRGIDTAAKNLSLVVEGGNVAMGDDRLGVSVTVIGKIANKASICQRNTTRVGDKIYVSGPLGNSAAGLYCFKNNIEGYEALKNSHKKPLARLDLVEQLATISSAMIDISDSLSSELYHIATASNVSLMIYEEKIPFSSELISFCESLNQKPLKMALSGGEDYELLFTSASDQVPTQMYQIGEVTDLKCSVGIKTSTGEVHELDVAGFDHVS